MSTKRMAKKMAKAPSESTGQKIAAKLVKQAGADAIYIGPWLLFRRVAGRNDTKQAVGWVRESIAEAVDAELAASKRGRHNQPLQRTERASRRSS